MSREGAGGGVGVKTGFPWAFEKVGFLLYL